MAGKLSSNKYKTPFRIVTGTPQLFPNDVVLLCDTLLAPVVINLLDIPTNYWSTQWKLYIVDFSNNSAVNNITINAGVGQLVNGVASFVINTNGAYSKITVGADAKFLSQNSTVTGGGGGGYSIIQDEGVPLPLQTVIDFQGAGVTAINGVGKTIITIPGGGGGASSFLFARKSLFIPPAIYVPVAGALTRSVVNGTPMTDFNFKNESGVTGFDLPTGAWIVDVTGWYSASAKLITRIDPASVDSNNNLGTFWMALPPPDGLGSISLALISQNTNILCSNKQLVTQNTSDINIDCSVEAVFLQAGDRVVTRILNKTDYDIVAVGTNPLLPDCTVQVAFERLS